MFGWFTNTDLFLIERHKKLSNITFKKIFSSFSIEKIQQTLLFLSHKLEWFAFEEPLAPTYLPELFCKCVSVEIHAKVRERVGFLLQLFMSVYIINQSVRTFPTQTFLVQWITNDLRTNWYLSIWTVVTKKSLISITTTAVSFIVTLRYTDLNVINIKNTGQQKNTFFQNALEFFIYSGREWCPEHDVAFSFPLN